MISNTTFQLSETATPYTTPVKYKRYVRTPDGKIVKDANGKKLRETVTEQVHNQGQEVFFITDIYELFGVPISYPGMVSAINAAFMAAKNVTPYKTGYSRKAFVMARLDDHRVKLYYDRSKIVGGMRLGKKVETYYPIWWFENSKLFNFLDIIMKKWYDTLYSNVRKLFMNNDVMFGNDPNKPSFAGFEVFIKEFNKLYYAKKEEAKQRLLAEQQAKQELAEKVKELKARIKLHKEEGVIKGEFKTTIEQEVE